MVEVVSWLWACLAAAGTSSVIFIDDRINAEVYRKHIFFANNSFKIILEMWQDNNPKHTDLTSSRGKWKVLDRPSQSPYRTPIDHAFYLNNGKAIKCYLSYLDVYTRE